MRAQFTFSFALFCLFLVVPAQAGVIVDGSWSDWGIDPTANDWDSDVGQRIFFEDYTGTDGTAFIGPGHGGQFFDVEAVFAEHRGSAVDFAIVTGFDLDGVKYGGVDYFSGDVFFDLGLGYTVAMDLETGKVFDNVTASVPMISSSGPLSITGGTYVYDGALSITSDGVQTVYSNGDTSSAHYLIEGTLDLSLLGASNQDVGIHWTMSCGNDVGRGGVAIPEPATLALFGLGAGVAALGSRRRRRRA